jgi:Fe2+ or Zn2+ uptake regulation protein
MKERRTPQLAAIYDALAASHDHPTADELFKRVRRVLPRVSLGTVYRNLDKLRAQGRLRVVRLEGGQAHFDAVVDAHDHFVCERCGAVADLPPTAAVPDVRRLTAAGYHVRWYTTALYGHCQDCTATESVAPRRGRRSRTAGHAQAE